MQSHHYALIILALLVGYVAAMLWPAPGQMARSAMGM